MHDESEEDIMRDLETYTPDMTAEFENTLRTLARLTQLMKRDAESALEGPESERERAVREVERKTDVLNHWLLKKADECSG